MRSLTITKVKPRGWEQCVLVNVLVEGVILIAEDMGALLACNLPQSQDTSTQTNVSKNRIVLDDSPSSGWLENRQATRIVPVIPLMPQNSDLEQSARIVTNAHSMASYLPWMSGVLEERLGERYWLSFNQRLPISYKMGDHLYRLLHCDQLPRDEEDVEGEIAEDTIEEEVI